MGGERREKSTLSATTEIANEIRMPVAIEFGHYIKGLKFSTYPVSEKREESRTYFYRLTSKKEVRKQAWL